MIDFVVVSSDLRPNVLDTRVRRGAELSTDHHLVVSWLRWWGRTPIGERPRTRWRDYVSQLAWERLGVPQEELVEVAGEREVWASLVRLLPPRHDPRKSGR